APGTRMDSIAGVTIRFTIDDVHVVGNLEGDAVAVIVLRYTVLDHGVTGLIEVNGPATAPIDIFVLVFVAIDDQVLEYDTFSVNCAENGESVLNACMEWLNTIVSKRHGTNTQRVSIHCDDRSDADIPAAI